MTLAVGVVDLGQDALEGALGVEDEVGRQRVEDVAEGAGVGQREDPVGRPGHTLDGEVARTFPPGPLRLPRWSTARILGTGAARREGGLGVVGVDQPRVVRWANP